VFVIHIGDSVGVVVVVTFIAVFGSIVVVTGISVAYVTYCCVGVAVVIDIGVVMYGVGVVGSYIILYRCCCTLCRLCLCVGVVDVDVGGDFGVDVSGVSVVGVGVAVGMVVVVFCCWCCKCCWLCWNWCR